MRGFHLGTYNLVRSTWASVTIIIIVVVATGRDLYVCKALPDGARRWCLSSSFVGSHSRGRKMIRTFSTSNLCKCSRPHSLNYSPKTGRLTCVLSGFRFASGGTLISLIGSCFSRLVVRSLMKVHRCGGAVHTLNRINYSDSSWCLLSSFVWPNPLRGSPIHLLLQSANGMVDSSGENGCVSGQIEIGIWHPPENKSKYLDHVTKLHEVSFCVLWSMY